MPRKAGIPESERLQWACVRSWVGIKGHSGFKANNNNNHSNNGRGSNTEEDGCLCNALVVLVHEVPADENLANDPLHPMRSLIGAMQEALLPDRTTKQPHLQFQQTENGNNTSDVGADFSATLVVDVSKLHIPREGDTCDVVAEEALMPQFGKRAEKPAVRFLERIHLRNATIVARGACCQFALKLLSPVASRALAPKHVARIVMLHPKLTPRFINEHMGVEASKQLKQVQLDVLYANEKKRRRRDPIIRASAPRGQSFVHESSDASMLLSVLKRCPQEVPQTETNFEFDASRCDESGRRVFFSELRIEMDPHTKADKQVVTDVTAQLQEEVSSCSEKNESRLDLDLAACVHEIGGLVLRGNRCALVRSLDGEWKGMKVPSLVPRSDESDAECAVRAISTFCEIDGEDQVVPIEHLPPVNVFMPQGRLAIVKMYVFMAANPPTQPLENADVEDEDDVYDWYTFPRAVAAVDGDEATIHALRTLAFALEGAARAGAVPVKWGGVFGQEFIAAQANALF